MEIAHAHIIEVLGMQIVLQVIESNVKRGSSVYEQDHVSNYSAVCYMHVWCMVLEFQNVNLASYAHMLHGLRYADLGASMGRQPEGSGSSMEGAQPGVPSIPCGWRQGRGGAVLPRQAGAYCACSRMHAPAPASAVAISQLHADTPVSGVQT